jgi:hypothetical protein
MKKFFVVALGVALCLTLAASAFAIDTESLESRTTEGLYDRNDAFDLARDPGHLYEIKPLHLWTIGSGYSGSPWGTDKYDGVYNDESQSFLVGVARELGPGSFAVFFELNNYAWETTELYSQYFQEENAFNDSPGNPFWNGAIDPANNYPNYDGEDDVLKDSSWRYYEDYERTEYNLALAYSMDFNDWISLGLSYEPQMIDEEETIDFNPEGLAFQTDPMDDSGGNNIQRLFFNNGSWFYNGSTSVPACWLNSGGPINSGLNYGSAFSSLFYADVEHTAWVGFEGSSAFDGKRDSERRVHPFELGSHIRPNDSWDFLVGIGYANIDQEDKVTGTYTGHWEAYGEDTEGEYGPWDTGTFVFSSDVTFTLGGSLEGDNPNWGNPSNADSAMESNYDGDHWSLYLSPTYFMNDMHSFRLDMGYGGESGDFSSGLSGRMDYAYNITTDINGEETDSDRDDGMKYEYDVNWTGYEVWDGACQDGDYENTSWFVEPRWYVNFDKVRFSMGLGYHSHQEEWSGTMAMNKTSHYVFDDGNSAYVPVDSGGDYTFDGSYTGRNTFNGEIETTTWRAPVAVEFDITEKLTCRVGAAYYQQTREERRSDSQVIRDNETYEIRDGNDQLVEVGFKELFNQDPMGNPDAIGQAYDQVDFGCAYEYNNKETYDWTTYNLGLGYYFTENLQFDLMFSGMSGWVDSSTLFGSFTIIFP